MKKIGILILLLITSLSLTVFSEDTVEVTIPQFPVEFNGVIMDPMYSDYPLFVYKGITYFPMTYNATQGLGLSAAFTNEEGLVINRIDPSLEIKEYRRSNKNPLWMNATRPSFAVAVNGQVVNNALEEYPILLMNNITYFPLTWKWVNDEFNWQLSFDNQTGLVIKSFSMEAEDKVDDGIVSRSDRSFIVDGKLLTTKLGKLAVPFETILNELGVDYKLMGSEFKTANISFEVGKKNIESDGMSFDSDFSPFVYHGEVYVSLDVISRLTNCSWDKILSVDYVEENVNEEAREDFSSLYPHDYLEELVETTEMADYVANFRKTKNTRRNGLKKVSGKFFDIYYPDDEKGQAVADFLAPHIDKVYVMLMDMYGSQAKVEVHLIHEEETTGLMEGKIREEEFITYIWIEENNDGEDGVNNLSEFVHEVNHNFFSKVNKGASNTMWINEAHAKLVPSLYTINLDYHNKIESYEFHIPNIDNKHMNSDHLVNLELADDYLEEPRAWGRSTGDLKKSQSTGIFFWQYMFHHNDYETFKYYLRNLGTGDVIKKIESLTGKDISYFDEELKKWREQE